MPIIEVWLNEAPLAVGGGDDFEVLTLGVIGNMASGPATVRLTGLLGPEFACAAIPG